MCATKRCYIINSPDNQNFPSTAKVALLDWIEKYIMSDSDLKNKYDDLQKNNEDFDEQWFFEYQDYKDKFSDKFYEFLKENIKNAKREYVLIHLDIDDLGKKLSELDMQGQKDLSNKLAEFAGKIEYIVDKNGKTIYAGGDDFLGFLNLSSLFNILENIEKEKNILNEFNLTFSISLIIAHYRFPLHKVLEYSRNLMKEIKNSFDEKNGMGVIVLKQSGVIAKSIYKKDFQKLLKELVNKKIGANLYFKLSREFNYLDEFTFEEMLLQKEMIYSEIKRILKRSNKFDENIYEGIKKLLLEQINRNYSNNYSFEIDNFYGFLKISEQLRGKCE